MCVKQIIAVVDDDVSILRAMDRLIRAKGYAAKVFSTGAEFLQSASAIAPDCVILDVQMPAMTGLELMSRMLALGMHYPVIFITAHEDAQAEARASDAGAVRFLYKPLRSEALWEAVQSALHRSVNNNSCR